MRDLRELEQYRVVTAYHGSSAGEARYGTFALPSPIDRKRLFVIACGDADWDHVSVSRLTRIPNWLEMSFIHRQFFKADEVAMQLHVPAKDHVNDHPYCLHLWRPHAVAIPLPPVWMVGGMTREEADRAYDQWMKGSG
jgi:hypothetical protein